MEMGGGLNFFSYIWVVKDRSVLEDMGAELGDVWLFTQLDFRQFQLRAHLGTSSIFMMISLWVIKVPHCVLFRPTAIIDIVLVEVTYGVLLRCTRPYLHILNLVVKMLATVISFIIMHIEDLKSVNHLDHVIYLVQFYTVDSGRRLHWIFRVEAIVWFICSHFVDLVCGVGLWVDHEKLWLGSKLPDLLPWQ